MQNVTDSLQHDQGYFHRAYPPLLREKISDRFGGVANSVLQPKELSLLRLHALFLCSIRPAYLEHNLCANPTILAVPENLDSWTNRMSLPRVAFIYTVRGEVALVVEPLPHRSVAGVGVRPGEPVARSVALVEERLEHIQVG